MFTKNIGNIREVPLPFSNGLLSAKFWRTETPQTAKGSQSKTLPSQTRYIAYVPELGLSSFGLTDSEASFRLFTTLIKYYRQLKANQDKLGERGLNHLELLKDWMSGIEERMTVKQVDELAGEKRVVSILSRLR
ncbi:MAG: hypothetical protein LCH63_04550 [Candidatus Melainabacteria bacterium]|nr:hypothetical protein [Candidatus Melainabacteria bacterium]